MMLIKAEQKFLRMSPQKLRFVSRGVKNIRDPEKLLNYLMMVRKRAAAPLAKVIKQAIANARNRGIVSALKIQEIQINDGPRIRRFRAGSMGRPQPILKKTSHIRVILKAEPQESAKFDDRREERGSKS